MNGYATLEPFQVDDSDGLVKRQCHYESPPADANTTSDQYQSLEDRYESVRRFESEYKKLGWTRGRYSSTRERDKARAFWVRSGADGARWLVQRIRDEPHVDVLDHVANLLADMGPACMSPILEKLREAPTLEQADVLLTAIGWLRESSNPQLLEVLADYARHQSADVRETCVLATRALGQSEAVRFLQEWRGTETNAEVIGVLDAEIASRTN
jgi:HEAT repeats